MKQILLTITFVFASILAFGQSDTTELNTYINTNFPDNTSGFITPERLRNVAKELMRSSANLQEINVFSEPLYVQDTVLSTVGYFTWDGSSWTEVGDLSDTTVWARSSGFILPLEYGDKLSVDTSRVEGWFYPSSDGDVNIGSESLKFDTVFADVFYGISDPWSVNGDTIYVGSVERIGIGTDSPVSKLDVRGEMRVTDDDSARFVLGMDTLKLFGGTLESYANGVIIRKDVGDWTYAMSVSADNVSNAVLTAMQVIDRESGEIRIIQVDSTKVELQYGTIGQGKNSIVMNDDGIRLKIQGSEESSYLITDSLVNRIQLWKKDSTIIGSTASPVVLRYLDGNESDGSVLVSDADGNASWQDPYAYGEMGFADSTHTLALTQNTPTWVTNASNDIWSVASVTMKDVTYSNDSLIVGMDGTYFFSGHLSVEGTTGSAIKAYTYKNGSVLCACVAEETLENNDIITLTIACDIAPLLDGDVITVWIENTASNDDVDLVSGKLTIHKIAP